MKKQPKTCFDIDAECINCYWKGSVQVEKRTHFLYWKCPRCGSRYCATTPWRVEENKGVIADGQKVA